MDTGSGDRVVARSDADGTTREVVTVTGFEDLAQARRPSNSGVPA
jgi:hypothetical protein